MDVGLVFGGLSTSRALAFATAAVLAFAAPAVGAAQTIESAPAHDSVAQPRADSAAGDVVAAKPDDRVFGRSGKLRARLLGAPGKGVLAFPFLSSLLKGKLGQPGIHPLDDKTLSRPLSFISLLPFSSKKNGRIGSYRMGFWPSEGRLRLGTYGNPDGFIDDAANQTQGVGSFRPRLPDQGSVQRWPKFRPRGSSSTDGVA